MKLTCVVSGQLFVGVWQAFFSRWKGRGGWLLSSKLLNQNFLPSPNPRLPHCPTISMQASCSTARCNREIVNPAVDRFTAAGSVGPATGGPKHDDEHRNPPLQLTLFRSSPTV